MTTIDRLAPWLGAVRVRRSQDDRLVPDVVAHRHDAPGHARERPGAGVLDEPLRATHGRGAVLAAGAEGAGAVAPQLARLGLLLLGGRVGSVPLRALGELL